MDSFPLSPSSFYASFSCNLWHLFQPNYVKLKKCFLSYCRQTACCCFNQTYLYLVASTRISLIKLWSGAPFHEAFELLSSSPPPMGRRCGVPQGSILWSLWFNIYMHTGVLQHLLPHANGMQLHYTAASWLRSLTVTEWVSNNHWVDEPDFPPVQCWNYSH